MLLWLKCREMSAQTGLRSAFNLWGGEMWGGTRGQDALLTEGMTEPMSNGDVDLQLAARCLLYHFDQFDRGCDP